MQNRCLTGLRSNQEEVSIKEINIFNTFYVYAQNLQVNFEFCICLKLFKTLILLEKLYYLQTVFSKTYIFHSKF